MWKLDCEEGWAPWFQTVVLKKTLESPLDCKETKLVNPKGNQLWILIGKADVKHSSNTLASDVKSRLIGKDPDAGKGWGQEKKGMTEDEMVGWNHRFNEYKYEQTLRDSEARGSLACRSSWSHKQLSDWIANHKAGPRSVIAHWVANEILSWPGNEHS